MTDTPRYQPGDEDLLHAIAVIIREIGPHCRTLGLGDPNVINTALVDPEAFTNKQFIDLAQVKCKWFQHHSPLSSAFYFLDINGTPLDKAEKRLIDQIHLVYDQLPRHIRLGINVHSPFLLSTEVET